MSALRGLDLKYFWGFSFSSVQKFLILFMTVSLKIPSSRSRGFIQKTIMCYKS